MGFLDFLKKQQAAPMPPPPEKATASAAPMPPPESTDGAFAMPPPPEVTSSPTNENPFETHNTISDDEDELPLPPKNMQDPDFLESAVASYQGKSPDDDLAKAPTHPEPVQEQKLPEPPVSDPAPHKAAQPESYDTHKESEWTKPATPVDLPDFTDDDFKQLETPAAPVQKPEPVQTQEPNEYDPIAAAAKVEQEAMATPTNPIPSVPDEPFTHIIPATFLSSDAYFMIADEMRATRAILRDNDEILKNAMLHHEQADEKFDRIVECTNDIQNKFMQLDTSLFED